MAVQGTPLISPFELSEVWLIGSMPMGDLITPFTQGPVDLMSAPLTSRFPVPPAAGGFLVDVDEEFENLSLSPPYFIIGAMYPESDYLEPTTGQIWPRG